MSTFLIHERRSEPLHIQPHRRAFTETLRSIREHGGERRSSRTSQYATYTPYGELFREYKKVLPYKFNGKELDQETGYYYYGARYYDPGTALWFGVDPLASKYPMNSPYVYCNANPVKYVDLDGRWPWENENIRRAREYAATCEPGYEVKLEDGQYGKDAFVVHSETGKVVYSKPATPSNQKSAIGNICSPGHADGFNLGTTTTADVRAVANLCEGVSDACDAVGTGLLVTGVGTAAGGVLYKAGTIAGYLSDGINIVVDVYEGKYQNGIKRMTTDFTGWVISNKLHTHNKESDMFLQKAVDKLFDSIIGNVTKDE